MKVQVEEISPIEKKLSIEVEPAKVAEELDRAYAALGRQVKLPGFRPGKIPRRILEQRFRAQIEDEVAGRVMQSAYIEALRTKDVPAVGQPQVTNAPKLQKDAPFTFEARVEVRPTLEPKEYGELPLTKRDATVTDAKVDEQIEQMRQSMSKLEAVEGRDVAQKGDFVTIDYTATIDGKDFVGSKAQDVTVEVAPGELVESNIAALEGVKVGDTKEIDYAFPTDYRVEDVRGKTARFAITVKGLKQKNVPAIDAEFAKNAAGLESVEELKKRLRQDLERAEKSRVQSEERQEILKALIEKNPFEAPRAMIERAIDSMLEGALRQMSRSGFDPSRLNLDFSALREEMRPRAVEEVKGTLLLDAIAQKEKLEATAADVDAKIEELAGEGGPAANQIRQLFRQPEQRESMGLRLREEKTIEFLKGRAKYS